MKITRKNFLRKKNIENDMYIEHSLSLCKE